MREPAGSCSANGDVTLPGKSPPTGRGREAEAEERRQAARLHLRRKHQLQRHRRALDDAAVSRSASFAPDEAVVRSARLTAHEEDFDLSGVKVSVVPEGQQELKWADSFAANVKPVSGSNAVDIELRLKACRRMPTAPSADASGSRQATRRAGALPALLRRLPEAGRERPASSAGKKKPQPVPAVKAGRRPLSSGRASTAPGVGSRHLEGALGRWHGDR